MREPTKKSPAPAAPPLPRATAQAGATPIAAARSAWLGWVIALAAVPPGWFFIGHANRWHLTAPVVVLGLAWLAVVGLGLTLVRASNVMLDEVPDGWFTATGTRDDLEHEKKTLIRTIKEIEFDRDTGKLSAADAQQLLAVYRARAIEVIKSLDAVGAQSPRARIVAELKARAELDRNAAKPGKAAKAAKARAGNGKAADRAPAAAAPAADPPAAPPADPAAHAAPADASDEVAVWDKAFDELSPAGAGPVAAPDAVAAAAGTAAAGFGAPAGVDELTVETASEPPAPTTEEVAS